MNIPVRCVSLAFLAATAVMDAVEARAATYMWDSSGTASSGNLVADGSGAWSTSNSNWWNSGTSMDQARNNATGDTAVFGAIPDTNSYAVTLAQATTAGSIIFQSQNYTIAGGGNAHTMSNSAASYATPDFSIAPGVAAIIDEETEDE
jgi:hypothetical protein